MPAIDPITLRTTRLLLRPLREHDLPTVFAMRSDPEVTRYWSSAPWQSMAEAEAWYAKTSALVAEGSAARWSITRADDPTMIGDCTVFHIDRDNRRGEIGYALARAHWGHGYATEAMRAVIEHAFGTLDLRRLEADIDPANAASARVLQRLGFSLEGRLRERWEVAGVVSDSDIYGLLQHEWPPA